MGKRAVIIGAGPAGLTAACELLEHTDIKPVVIEATGRVGGISTTIDYKGNRIDIGGHRFFSKSDRVTDWWLDMIPLDGEGDRVMLLRERKSRILFSGHLFDYPVSLSRKTLMGLGLYRAALITLSYIKSAVFPRKEESLEDFFINRFGRQLYLTFFKSYTEKVWGMPCSEISAEWGAQRVKGLSVAKTISHLARKIVRRRDDVEQKDVETSLIERFYYPKFGPGQMWEEAARAVVEKGGELLTSFRVDKVATEGGRVTAVEASNPETGERRRLEGDYIFSTMPVRDLVRALAPEAPPAIREIGEGLVYRDFMTVGLLLDRLRVGGGEGGAITDNWIYIQEPGVLVGRLQIFNNWSPYMVADPAKTWVGLEYFCFETDEIWKMGDEEMVELAAGELERIGFIEPSDVLDGTVIRMPKTYPAYFGTYERFDELKDYLDGIDRLFLIGRNGMHRYNNQDHSMLSAMLAVDNIVEGRSDKSNIWDVNADEEYHEE